MHAFRHACGNVEQPLILFEYAQVVVRPYSKEFQERGDQISMLACEAARDAESVMPRSELLVQRAGLYRFRPRTKSH